MKNPLEPDAGLLCKLGSIVVHADELLSPEGHAFDRSVLDALLSDPDVKEWIEEMRAMALVPERRTDTRPECSCYSVPGDDRHCGVHNSW